MTLHNCNSRIIEHFRLVGEASFAVSALAEALTGAAEPERRDMCAAAGRAALEKSIGLFSREGFIAWMRENGDGENVGERFADACVSAVRALQNALHGDGDLNILDTMLAINYSMARLEAYHSRIPGMQTELILFSAIGGFFDTKDARERGIPELSAMYDALLADEPTTRAYIVPVIEQYVRERDADMAENGYDAVEALN